MVSQRPDVQRVIQHFGLDSNAFQQFPRQALAGAASLMAARASVQGKSRPICFDPAAKAAALRARLLASLSGRTQN